MSDDILNPMNNIKSSINENDQVLWQYQASAQCFKQESEKLEEKCEILNKEIMRIKKEIGELEPQTQILSSSYEVLAESLVLNQESLVNQRLYKRRIVESIESHQRDVNLTIDEYSQHLQKCKEKLETTNPTFKLLQTKKIELKKCKIHCLSLKKQIDNLKERNQQRTDIRKKLFYGDIIGFAQAWLKHKQYLEATSILNKVTQTEREYMKRLVEITEQLKKKQKMGCYRKEIAFNITHIEFPKSDTSIGQKKAPEKPEIPLNPLTDIKNLLERNFADARINKQNANVTNRRLEFNPSNTKIRILEHMTLNSSYNEKSLVLQSREERSKAIVEKLQIAQNNAKKNLFRQNSRGSGKVNPSEAQDNLNAKLSQQSNASQSNEVTKMDVEQNVKYNGSGATQSLLNLSIDPDDNVEPQALSAPIQESNRSSAQVHKDDYKCTPNVHLLNHQKDLSAKAEAQKVHIKPSNIGKKPSSQENKLHSMTIKNFNFMEKSITNANNSQKSTNVNQKSEAPYFADKSQLFSSGFGAALSRNFAKGNNGQRNSPIFKKPEMIRAEKPQNKENATEPIQGVAQENTIYNSKYYATGGQLGLHVRGNGNTPTIDTHDQLRLGNETISNVDRKINNEGKTTTENFNIAPDSFMKMSGTLSHNFGTDTQFSQILNETYDYEPGTTSPQFDNTFIGSPQPDGVNIPSDSENQSSFPNQLFNFHQPSNIFEFKKFF